MALTPYLSPLTFPYFSAGSIASTDNRMFRYDVSTPQPRLPLRLSADEIGHPPPASERVQHHDLVEQ